MSVPQDDPETVQFTIRIPAEHSVALRRIAGASDRTPAAEIRRLIRLHVERDASGDESGDHVEPSVATVPAVDESQLDPVLADGTLGAHGEQPKGIGVDTPVAHPAYRTRRLPLKRLTG